MCARGCHRLDAILTAVHSAKASWHFRRSTLPVPAGLMLLRSVACVRFSADHTLILTFRMQGMGLDLDEHVNSTRPLLFIVCRCDRVSNQPYKVFWLIFTCGLLSGNCCPEVQVGVGPQHDATVIGCVAPHLGHVHAGILTLAGLLLSGFIFCLWFVFLAENAIVVFAPLSWIDPTVRISFACFAIH